MQCTALYSLSDIFRDCNAFDCPMYHRSYCWTTRQQARLTEDVFETVSDSDETLRTMFLGPVLVARQTGPSMLDGPAGHSYMVIDGLQRLMSMTLLLCAIDDLASERGGRTVVSGMTDILWQPAIDSMPLRPRLGVGFVDHESWRSVLRGRQLGADGQHPVVAAYRYFRSALLPRVVEAANPTAELRVLQRAADGVLHGVRMSVVCLDAAVDQHRAYMSVNRAGVVRSRR